MREQVRSRRMIRRFGILMGMMGILLLVKGVDAVVGVDAVPPSAVIVFPSDGSALYEGVTLPLRGMGDDPEEGRLKGDRLSWHSDKDGPLGEGETLPVLLSAGTHVITLTVTDSEGLSANAQITITVTPR